MKKICAILLLLIAIVLSFSACNKAEQGDSIERPKASVTIEPKPSTGNISSTSNANTQSPAPKPTMNVGSKDDLSTIIGTLNEELNGINDKNLTHDERVEITTKFIENLAKFLRIKESTKLSDEDLQKALDYNIVAKTNVQNIDGTSVRIVRFDGLPELFGTLERKWTYIQWWTDMGVHSQIIINKGAEVTDDYLFSKVKGIPTVILSGYQTTYKPYPVFLSTWQLTDGEWKKVNLFSNNMVSNEIWNIKVSENMMTIESKNTDELTVGLNQQKDGFEVYSEADQNKKLEFKLQGGQIVLQ
jgi:hypothetical protein